MLQIKTTPNLYGITLSGDYLDLNSLYDSLSRYLEFYQDNMSKFYPYHEYEYLLSLNYDLRKAYEGCRNVETVDNNSSSVGVLAECVFEIPASSKKAFKKTRKDFSQGNLYYSVEILYPLVFHYLISFENILEEEIMDEWFNEKEESAWKWMKEYNLIDAERDRAKIKEFVTLLWENVQSLFGKDRAQTIYEYYLSVEYPFVYSIYCDALIHCQLASFPDMNRTEKIDFLLLCLYEIIDTEDLIKYTTTFTHDSKIYTCAFANLKKKGKKIIPTREEFFRLLEEENAPDKPMYQDDFDKMLEKEFGPAPEDDPDW